MGFFDHVAGAASGASNAIEEMVARQFQQLLAKQQMEQAQQRIDLDKASLNQRALEQDSLAKYRTASLDAQDAARRDRNNQAGLEEMYRQHELMQPPPPPKRTVVTTIGKRGEPMRQAFTDDELSQGVPEYREPKAPAAASTPEQIFVKRNGVITPIRKGTAQPGDVPYDAVAERASAAGTNMTEEARRTAEEVLRVTEALSQHQDRGSIFGALQGAMPNVRQGAIDAQSLLEQLNGLLTLDNMGKMKGVLSDKDMAVIRQASSRLSNQRISDDAATSELANIANTVRQKLGQGGGEQGGGGLAPGTERVINGTPAVWDGRGWLPKR